MKKTYLRYLIIYVHICHTCIENIYVYRVFFFYACMKNISIWILRDFVTLKSPKNRVSFVGLRLETPWARTITITFRSKEFGVPTGMKYTFLRLTTPSGQPRYTLEAPLKIPKTTSSTSRNGRRGSVSKLREWLTCRLRHRPVRLTFAKRRTRCSTSTTNKGSHSAL